MATTHLYVLGECPEHLLGDLESLEKVLSPSYVNGLVVRVVPVEVRDAFLKMKKIVHRAYHNVHRGRVPSLSSEIVLKVSVVTLAEKLKETEETLGEEVVRKDLAQNYNE